MYLVFQPAPALLRTKLARVRHLLVGQSQLSKKTARRTSRWPRWVVWLLRSFLIVINLVAILIGVIFFVPEAYYQFFPADTQPIAEYQTAVDNAEAKDQLAEPSLPPQALPPRVLPPQDETLPEGEWVVIPRIGVRSQLRPTEDPEAALQKGVWQVPDYGQPGDTELPMILAAHRFGWQWWWKTDYWQYNSFYRLPELEVGDRVEIIADQRKWTYEIYSAPEGNEIEDYDADLILYTCKFLNSPVRYFRYANLVVDAEI